MLLVFPSLSFPPIYCTKHTKDDCIGCGACEGTCPVGAISADANGKYEIADSCVDCGACASVCPVEAIKA